MKEYLSPHSIAIYRRCPRAFYYYINEYPQLKPPYYMLEALELGSFIHELIKNYYDMLLANNQDGNIEALRVYLREAYNKLRTKYKVASDKDKIKPFVTNFIKFEQWRISKQVFRPLYVEHEIVNEEYKIHGIVDVVFQRDNGKYVIVDWKTGQNASVINYDIRTQLSIYAFILKTDEAYIVNLARGYHLEKVDIILPSKLIEIIEFIREDKIYAPMYGEHCRTCVFQLLCKKPVMRVNPVKVVEL